MRTIVTLVTVLGLVCLPSGEATAQRTDEERRLDRAFDLIREGELAAAESILREVDARDTNDWLELYDRPPGHWVAREYMAAIERIRAGGESDDFFASERFRFHVRGVTLEPNERDRVARTFEDVLTRVAEWADEASWLTDDHRIVFVEIAESFPTPSPARTLIFFWDRQDRAPRMEVTTRALNPRFLTPILAHELTHVVLPHTARPLAEGMANLAAREIFPDRPNPIRSRVPPDAEHWPLEEVLLFNVRAQGAKVRRQIELLRAGGFSPEALELTGLMYRHGDDLVRMILERWGKARLMEVYRATNRDPVTIDVLDVVSAHLGPMEELRRMWEESVGG